MRKSMVYSLIILSLLTGCSNIQKSTPALIVDSDVNHPVELTDSSDSEQINSYVDWEHIIIEQANGESGMFYLGMTLNDVYALDLYNTDYEITQITKLEDGQTVIWTPILSMLFDTEEILYRINVNGELPTPVGLKNGDSKNLLENLFGKSDTTYDSESSIVEEYNLGDFYFYANISEGKVNVWGISTYTYDYVTPHEAEINEPDHIDEIPSQSILTEIEALELIESKLDEEQLRISYLGLVGTDEMGNYIVRQSSSATTEVMEWYYVNPTTQEITCDFMAGSCLQETSDIEDNITEPLTMQQLDAIQTARLYAQANYSRVGYMDGVTYVIYSHDDEDGNIVIWVFNPGSGATNTIDWLTIDSSNKQVINSQMGGMTTEDNEQQYETINGLLKVNKVFEIDLYGYGWFVYNKPPNIVGHGGNIFGYSTTIRRNLENKNLIVVMNNFDSNNEIEIIAERLDEILEQFID